VKLTRNNETYCHKWAVLLEKRRLKMEQATAAIHSGEFEKAQIFVSKIFHGEESRKSMDTDPGMVGVIALSYGYVD